MQSSFVERTRPYYRHWLFRYGLAAALFGATLGLSIGLTRLGVNLNFTIPIVVSLVAAAWYGGFGPGVLISILFQGTTILYATSAANLTPGARWFQYFSVFSLYIFLSFVISSLRRTTARLSEHRDLLQITLKSIADGVITTDNAGRITFMNPVAAELTGWDSSALGRKLGEVFRLVDEDTHGHVEAPAQTILAGGPSVERANHTALVSRTGKEIPIAHTSAPIREGNEVKGVVVVFSDVSSRKEAERARRQSELMTGINAAQERERMRIARDLHDHLGQRMTGLRLRVEAVADECEKYEEIANSLAEIQEAANRIDRDVAFLAWELRPTELENLGLDDAIESYVKEWSRQYGIQADFHVSATGGSRMLQRLPRETETNVYRIVQESLNNVWKHANATSVSVLMQYGRDSLTLIVEDDGTGYDDMLHPNDSSPNGGLGLMGMRERAEVLGGTLGIETAEKGGTTVIVKIPIDAAPVEQAAAVASA